VIVTLGDAPRIVPEVISLFAGAAPGTRAVYHGRPGHPVVLGPREIAALASLKGDHGAREVVRGGGVIECGSLCSGRDVDTPEDLEAVRGEARAVL
jgi:CTP:molybdopterin cytidylyltransferase MocA